MHSYTEAIQLATKTALLDDRVHVLGLGAVYKNGLDGSMGDLVKEFPDRIHDTPCSEAAVTGMAMGMALMGLRPLVHHGRVEFALYAANQILTEMANWNYEFGDYPCPVTLRIALGRQWGNGPAHTRNTKGLFAVPGLKVVCPSTPQMAHDLLITAMEDNNPVIYLEPRWCYKLKEEISTKKYGVSLSEARVLKRGNYMTIVAVGDMVVEALRAAKMIEAKHKLDVEVIDLVSVYPVPMETIISSVSRTRGLVVCESSTYPYSVASQVAEGVLRELTCRFAHISCPDYPCPTALSLTKHYYPTATDIANKVMNLYDGYVGTFEANETFEQLHLPPTDNITDLLQDLNGYKSQASS